jgi:hypothetical protein
MYKRQDGRISRSREKKNGFWPESETVNSPTINYFSKMPKYRNTPSPRVVDNHELRLLQLIAKLCPE